MYYLYRLNESCFGLPLTPLAKDMINDLVVLSTFSMYGNVRSKAQNALQQTFKHIPFAANEFLPSIIERLSVKSTKKRMYNSVATEEELYKVEGIVHLLSSRTVLRRIIKNWKLLSSFMLNLAQSSVHDKVTISWCVFICFCFLFFCKKNKKQKQMKTHKEIYHL